MITPKDLQLEHPHVNNEEKIVNAIGLLTINLKRIDEQIEKENQAIKEAQGNRLCDGLTINCQCPPCLFIVNRIKFKEKLENEKSSINVSIDVWFKDFKKNLIQQQLLTTAH